MIFITTIGMKYREVHLVVRRKKKDGGKKLHPKDELVIFTLHFMVLTFSYSEIQDEWGILHAWTQWEMHIKFYC
jgi:hypothetical protein